MKPVRLLLMSCSIIGSDGGCSIGLRVHVLARRAMSRLKFSALFAPLVRQNEFFGIYISSLIGIATVLCERDNRNRPVSLLIGRKQKLEIADGKANLSVRSRLTHACGFVIVVSVRSP
jgi:hypothetical protein